MTIDRALLVAQIREAEEALLDAEDELKRIRRAEDKAARHVNARALAAATLIRALEVHDEIPSRTGGNCACGRIHPPPRCWVASLHGRH